MLPALAAALALASTGLPGPAAEVLEPSPFTASVAVGGSWDTNLDRLSGPRALAASGSLGWRASAGWIFLPGEEGALLLEATYAGEQYADGVAPAAHRPGAAGAWVRPLGERLTLRLGSTAAWLASEDPARAGLEAGASASLGLAVARPLQLRVAVSGLRGEAASDAWSTHRTRLRGSAIFTPWSGASLVLGYAWQTGTDTAWIADPAAPTTSLSGYGPGPGGAGTGGGTGSWATAGLVAVATPASTHVFSVDAEQALGDHLFIAAGWSYSSGTSAVAGAWTGQSAQLEIGWRR